MATMAFGCRHWMIAALLPWIAACGRGPEPAPVPLGPPSAPPATSSLPPGPMSVARSSEPPAPPPVPAFDPAPYPWLADDTCRGPQPVESLERRFPAPPGFRRPPLPERSFGAWLRTLPLAAPGTPVRTYRGDVLLPADHANIAAVAALDIGTGDLQQCADSVIRLHGEWQWWLGRRDMAYRAAAGVPIPFARWAQGDRLQAKGASLEWRVKAAPARTDHATFRKYMDAVFMFANTGSVAKQAGEAKVEQLAPGDFVVQAGNPGHAVLVLDIALADDGRKVALLGQGYMPAQSFQVLRPTGGSPWFPIDAASEALTTPFWRPFPWSLLRRWGEPG